MKIQQERRSAPGTGGLLAGMAMFVIVGFPMVFFIWRFVNEILSGRFVLVDAGLALVFSLMFAGLLRVLASRVRRWDAGIST